MSLCLWQLFYSLVVVVNQVYIKGSYLVLYSIHSHVSFHLSFWRRLTNIVLLNACRDEHIIIANNNTPAQSLVDMSEYFVE